MPPAILLDVTTLVVQQQLCVSPIELIRKSKLLPRSALRYFCADGQCQCQTCSKDLKIILSDILEVGGAAKACKMAKYSVTKRSSVPLSERTLLAVMVPIEARDT